MIIAELLSGSGAHPVYHHGLSGWPADGEPFLEKPVA
jgi:hypothetical protein